MMIPASRARSCHRRRPPGAAEPAPPGLFGSCSETHPARPPARGPPWIGSPRVARHPRRRHSPWYLAPRPAATPARAPARRPGPWRPWRARGSSGRRRARARRCAHRGRGLPRRSPWLLLRGGARERGLSARRQRPQSSRRGRSPPPRPPVPARGSGQPGGASTAPRPAHLARGPPTTTAVCCPARRLRAPAPECLDRSPSCCPPGSSDFGRPPPVWTGHRPVGRR
mmetsp:Transcript_107243/g.272176  ORF Transcript_107243/g.272176 Transcript_107243/m.272176 type:complete len:226 (-) Transcript_107243:851-1528(-)